MLQTDLADDSDSARQKHLKDTIDRALGEVMPGEREALLKDLLLKFPAWDSHELAHGDDRSEIGLSNQDQRDLEDPAFLVQRLIGVSGSLSPEQRRGLCQQLSEAGLMEDPQQAWPEDSVERLRSTLEMEPDQPIDSKRLLDLVQMLSELTVRIDQVSWATWRNVAPRSALRRGKAINRTVSRFLSGDPQITRSQVSQELQQLRQLALSLIMALSRASEQFANDFLARLAPEHIESLVPKSVLPGHQERMYWRKYKQLTVELSDMAIEQEIKQAIAQYVQSLMIGVDHAHP